MHSVEKTRGAEVINIDMMKSYNRVEWNYLDGYYVAARHPSFFCHINHERFSVEKESWYSNQLEAYPSRWSYLAVFVFINR